MANDIWVQRYEALRSLQQSFSYVAEMASTIKTSWDKTEDSVPDRVLGYATSLAKYQRMLISLWSVLYDDNEYLAAIEDETPKLMLPPTMSLDSEGIPHTIPPTLEDGPVVVDNEAAVAASQSAAPGFGEETEINIGWFGNLVNLMNNYIADGRPEWTAIWKLIGQGMGFANRTSYWAVSGESDRFSPIPEYQGHPNELSPATWVDDVTALKHFQIFRYGGQNITMKLYEQDGVILVELGVAVHSTSSSLLIGNPFIGEILVRSDEMYCLDGIKIPILRNGINGYEYSYVHILFKIFNNVLTLSFSGISNTQTDRVASNTAYTAVCIAKPDKAWSNIITPENSWEIYASKKGKLFFYEVAYLGRLPGPVPPPAPPGSLTVDNIGTCVLESITANKFIETSDPPKAPPIGGDYPLTVDNIGTAIFEKVYARHFVTSDDIHPPKTKTGNLLYYSTFGVAVFDYINAKEFITTTDAPKPPSTNELPKKGGVPVVRDMAYSFYYEQDKICFAPTSDSDIVLPEEFRPNDPLVLPLHGFVYDQYKRKAIDMQIIVDKEGEMPAYGIYSEMGDGPYTHVYDFVNSNWAIQCQGKPRWYKSADKFNFRVYVENGIIVYSFIANYAMNKLPGWGNGNYPIISVGEMPRNFYPTQHLIIQLGHMSYLIVQSNGGVRLVSDGTPIRQGVVFSGVWINQSESSIETGTRKVLPSMRDKVKIRSFEGNPLQHLKENHITYSWPAMNLSKFDLDENNGRLFSYSYELLNLRTPLLDQDGKIVSTDEQINYMLSHKDEIRIHMGQGSVIRLHNVQTDVIQGYSGVVKTGIYTMYFVLCEFLWAQPQIKWIIDDSEVLKSRLDEVLTSWDALSVTEYFTAILNHLDDITDSITLVTSLTNQLSSELSGEEIAAIPQLATTTGIDSFNM